jgi:glycosyltransferase involved in cell wall biosynthesis
LRILHVITTINRGGAENHVADLAVGQAERGLAVTVAFLKGDGYWAKRLEDGGVRVVPLGLERYGAVVPARRLRRLLGDFEPDLVHAHLPPAELYARIALLARNRALPLVITKHNDEPFYPGTGHQMLCGWVLRRACRAIAISDAVNRYMRNQVQLAADKFQTVHYGIDSHSFESVDAHRQRALRAEWGIENDEMVIGTVARLVPQKSLHVLLSAFARYRSIGRPSARLVIVGRGPLLGELQTLADRLAISDAIVWAGFREDIPAVMNAFDVFSLTSAYEGFGLVLLEAMAASRPVVATAISAIPEIVQNEHTGLLCEVDDAEALASAFRRMEDGDFRATLGRNGLQRVRTHFGLDRVTETTLAIYRECLA